MALVKCAAPGGIWPSALRAALRMKACARVDRAGRDAGPDADQTDARPASWSGCGSGRRARAGSGRRARGLQREAGAAGAAHAERVPAVRAAPACSPPSANTTSTWSDGGASVGAARGRDDGRRPARRRRSRWRRARARRCRRRASTAAALERTLPPPWPSVVEEASSICSLRDAGAAGLHPGIAVAVADHAGHLDLVHRVDHRGRGAGAAERVADVDHVGDRGALAAEIAGTMMPSRRCSRAAANASSGKRASRSTPPALAAATAAV